jgi:hypothetical protein
MEKTITLPHDLHSALQEAATRSGQSEDEIVREAIDAYLRQLNPPPEKRPIPRSIGSAELTVNGEDLEAWLASNWRPD